MPIPRSTGFLTLLAAVLASAGPLLAADLVIRADKPGPAVSPTLYGIFFEDINRAGDGGLYAEMVQNRSFEDAHVPIAWTLVKTGGADGTITLDTTHPLNPKNSTCLRLDVTRAGDAAGGVGVSNEGFKGVPLQGKDPNERALQSWATRSAEAAKKSREGMHVAAGKDYLFSLYARADTAAAALTVRLEKQDGTVLARQTIEGLGGVWRKIDARLTASATDSDARLVVSSNTVGTVWLDMVSLFPADTYKGRPNGFRPDLVQMMLDMHPGLLRFPGGSFSEGAVLKDAWRWKETIGDVAERGSNWNIWGYRTTNGIGFHEYLQLAEDLGAEPLFVAHVGMAEKGFVPLNELEPWIQDVLDAIEYANGPATSTWGALRAKAGHPEPFHLKYVEIGNENGMGYAWGGGTRADYLPRYKAFYERIKATYPDIVTIANIHTEPDAPADIVDEHYYESSEWFFKNATMYDTYDRTKPKVYVGEYAAKPDGGNGNMRGALGEAAFLTGVERNADVVTMTSYAPLFTNPPWQRWQPNAIVFNNTTAYGTPSYHVQAMFAAHRPDTMLTVELPVATGVPTLFASAGVKKDSGDLILKVVNRAGTAATLDLKLVGTAGPFASGTCVELSAASPTEENSFTNPRKIAPRTTALPGLAGPTPREFPPFSVTVLRWMKQ
jgi:alpha-L-arabinofuranosidase